MINNSQQPSPLINLSNLLARFLVVVGMVLLLSGFTFTEIEFNSADVPPSKFKVRQAQQQGLPAPKGTPGLPVKATLSKPKGAGPFPAIVLFPTSGGWQDTPRHWRERLNAWGYVTLQVGAENEIPERFEPTIQVLDAIGALNHLQEVSYVDKDSITVMGWSLGADTELWVIDASSWAGNHQIRFSAAVAIYPSCEAVGQFFSPALIISAEHDDIARPSGCERLVNSIPAGSNVPIMKIMPGAYHWFDLPHRPAQTYDMNYEYNAKATEAAIGHIRSFLDANF